MTEELKPCPFCGGKPKFAKSGADAWVFCSNCGATQDSCKTNEEAVDNWNARLIEDIAERKRLKELLKSCCNEFVPRDKRTAPNYPVCYRNCGIIDKDGHCTARGECPIYAELTKRG